METLNSISHRGRLQGSAHPRFSTVLLRTVSHWERLQRQAALPGAVEPNPKDCSWLSAMYKWEDSGLGLVYPVLVGPLTPHQYSQFSEVPQTHARTAGTTFLCHSITACLPGSTPQEDKPGGRKLAACSCSSDSTLGDSIGFLHRSYHPGLRGGVGWGVEQWKRNHSCSL